MTQSSPSRTARVRTPPVSEPAPGSEKSWHQISSPARPGRRKRALSSGAAHIITVGRPMPMLISKIMPGTR